MVGPRTIQDFKLAVQRGQVSDVSCGYKFGTNADVDIGTEDIVNQGGSINYIAAGGDQLSVVSGSGADDGNPVGNGARTVRLFYLDENYVEQTEDITMEGASKSDTIATDILRPLRMVVLTAGVTGYNEGIITLEPTASGTIYLQIEIGANQTQFAATTVPAGKRMHITHWHITTRTAPTTATTVQLMATAVDETTASAVFCLKREAVFSGADSLEEHLPLVFPAETDIKIQAIADVANQIVTAAFDYYLTNV